MKQAGFAPILIVFLITILGLGGFFIYSRIIPTTSISPPPNQTACTLEAKLCPDGSSVGRSGPKCEFSPCPTPKSTTSADLTNWKTYISKKYGFEIKIPSAWEVMENPTTPNEYLRFGPIEDVNHIGEKVKSYVGLGLWLEIMPNTDNQKNMENAEDVLNCESDNKENRKYSKINDREVLINYDSTCGLTSMDTLLWFDDIKIYMLNTYQDIDPFLPSFKFTH